MTDEQLQALEGHTPGPWKRFNGIGDGLVIEVDGRTLAQVDGHNRVDSKLIAAAPMMRLALIEARSDRDVYKGLTAEAQSIARDAQAAARAAITQRDKLAEAVEAYKVADFGTEEGHFAYDNLMRTLEEVT